MKAVRILIAPFAEKPAMHLVKEHVDERLAFWMRMKFNYPSIPTMIVHSRVAQQIIIRLTDGAHT